MRLYSFLLIFISIMAFSNIHLPSVFTDNMVLQRNSEVEIWGSAEPNEEITLKSDFLTKEYKVKTGSDAIFRFKVPTGKEGGPYTISLKGYNEVILKNVMLGEVWLVSGQSNMEMSAAWGIKDGDAEIAKANYPNIRLFGVAKGSSAFPQNNAFSTFGSWLPCDSNSMKYFSAVGYFFAQRLSEELENVPIGIIASAWGGSSAELWTPENVFKEKPALLESFKKLGTSEYYPSQTSGAYNSMIYPFKNYKIAGVLWYQGETNTGNSESYNTLLSSMIESWRKDRGYSFPFYIVQIAQYQNWEDSNVKLRNIQRIVAKTVPESGLVVTADVSTADDLHPKDKKPVGVRLANLALKNIYKLPLGLVESPEWKSAEFKGNKAILSLEKAEGLHFKNGTSNLFEIAGNDGKFYPAKATIQNTQITVEAPEVKNPVKVRYNWDSKTAPDLFNKSELPASVYINE